LKSHPHLISSPLEGEEEARRGGKNPRPKLKKWGIYADLQMRQSL